VADRPTLREIGIWPRRDFSWQQDGTECISIPFTWNIPSVLEHVLAEPSRQFLVGGPAVYLLPDVFEGTSNVTVGRVAPGILQRVNPWATRTSTGCIRACSFCGVSQFEPGGLRELPDWPDLPCLCDNALLATSESHFDRVIDRLAAWGVADFNQGLDIRLLTDHHAMRLSEIKDPMIRLALDNDRDRDSFIRAYCRLRDAGVRKASIMCYCLVGYEDTPEKAWRRCEWVAGFGIKPLPMWYHCLTETEHNPVTYQQRFLGWTESRRQGIMGYYYRHRDNGEILLDLEELPCG
jgi:hypothetical protein